MENKKKQYSRPELKEVRLKLDEAVLADCKSPTGPASGGCDSTGGTTCTFDIVS
jgi:hypothetical protein